MLETGTDPSHLMEEHNRTNERSRRSPNSYRLIEQNPQQVEQIKAGKVVLVKWFVGVVMKSTEGRANPTATEEEVKRQLGL